MRAFVSGLAILAILSALTYQVGVRFNTTNSLPRGLYLVVAEPVQAGAIVLACPPEGAISQAALRRGYLGVSPDCPGQLQRLIKRVVGTPGDEISAAASGELQVNGRTLQNSAPLREDLHGRPLAPYFTHSEVLQAGEFLVMGDTAKSFDGRYFGPIQQSHIRAVMRPIWTL